MHTATHRPTPFTSSPPSFVSSLMAPGHSWITRGPLRRLTGQLLITVAFLILMEKSWGGPLLDGLPSTLFPTITFCPPPPASSRVYSCSSCKVTLPCSPQGTAPVPGPAAVGQGKLRAAPISSPAPTHPLWSKEPWEPGTAMASQQ